MEYLFQTDSFFWQQCAVRCCCWLGLAGSGARAADGSSGGPRKDLLQQSKDVSAYIAACQWNINLLDRSFSLTLIECVHAKE